MSRSGARLRRQHGQVRHGGQQLADLPGVSQKAVEAVEYQQRRSAARRAAKLLPELGRRGGHNRERARRLGHQHTGVLDALEIDVHRAAGETVRHRPSGLQRQARLAHAARAHERDQPHGGAHEQLADLEDLSFTTDRLVGRRRQPGGEHGGRPVGQQLGIVREDHALEPTQLRARLDPELVHQHAPALAHHLERVRLPAGTIERNHQLRAQPLAQRMLRNQSLQLACEIRGAPQSQVRGNPLLDRLHVQLLQARDLLLGELVEAMIGQRRPAPQTQRRPEIGGGALRIVAPGRHSGAPHEFLESAAVDRVRIDLQRVARPAMAHRRVVTEPPAQARDLLLQGLHRAGRDLLSPEVLQQLVGRHRVGRMQRQRDKHPALL